MSTTTSDARTSLLQVVRTPQGFRAFDPEYVVKSSDVVEKHGRLTARTGAVPGFGTFLISVLGAVGLPWWLGGPWYLIVVWAILGMFGAFIVACMGLGMFFKDDAEVYAKAHGGARPELDITDRVGVTICHIALDLVESDAWQRGDVDPERSLAGAVWQSARRGEQAEKLREWIESSRRAGLDQAQTADAQNEEIGLRRSVGRTEHNLRELLGVAHQVTHAARRPGASAGPSRAAHSRYDDDDLSEQMLVHGHAVRDLLR